MKVVNQVHQTNDYELFSKIHGNRVVNRLHVERLKTSFQKAYLLSPIIVNEKYEIIDGQHRFNAAKHLRLPINFIMVNDYGLKEVQMLNANMKNWKKEDYLHGYCDLGYIEYLKMKKFMDDFPELGFASSELILSNVFGGVNNKSKAAKIDGKNVGRMKNFQEGNFKVYDLELAYENAEKIMMFKPYYDGFYRAVFVSAMITIFKNPNYNHNQMMARLSSNPTMLIHCANSTQYKILLEEIYNFRSREKVNLRY